MYVWIVGIAGELLDAHLGNGTGRRTVTMAALLLLTSGPARYEAVLHGCVTSLLGGGTDLCQCTLVVALLCCLTGTSGCQYHNLYPTQSHYPDTEPTNPFPILIMLGAWLESDKYQFQSHWIDSSSHPDWLVTRGQLTGF